MECRLFSQLYRTIQYVVGVTSTRNGYFHLYAETSINIPRPDIIYIICALQWYTEIVNRLLLADAVATASCLKV